MKSVCEAVAIALQISRNEQSAVRIGTPAAGQQAWLPALRSIETSQEQSITKRCICLIAHIAGDNIRPMKSHRANIAVAAPATIVSKYLDSLFTALTSIPPLSRHRCGKEHFDLTTSQVAT